jgi:hypothetical protein
VEPLLFRTLNGFSDFCEWEAPAIVQAVLVRTMSKPSSSEVTVHAENLVAFWITVLYYPCMEVTL